MLSTLQANPEARVPEVYNQTFYKVDASLSKISEDSHGKMHSGCTAVTAFLRIEDAEGRQSFVKALPNSPPTPTSGNDTQGAETDDSTSGNGEVSDGQSKTSSQSQLEKAPEWFS
jgi:protein phosphatase PTC1